MTFTRLQTADPDLVAQLRAASPDAQRRAAYAAAETAVAHTRLDQSVVSRAVDRMRANSRPIELRDELSHVVGDLDELAWDRQEQVDTGVASRDEYLRAFGAARAAAAVLAALDDDPVAAALESAYEAQAATGDIAPIRETTLAALRDRPNFSV